MTSQFGSKVSAILVPALKGFLIGIALLGVFLAGFFFRDALSVPGTGAVLAEGSNQYGLLSEVQDLLEQNYLRDLPPSQDLEYAAIRGFMSALEDPYTFFVDPPVARSESDVLAGKYGGIGVQVQHAADGKFLLYPFAGGPAAEAGIEDGDVLIAIGDWELDLHSRMDAVDQAMRGEVGDDNGVTLTIQKRSDGSEVQHKIAFAVIEVPSVLWRQLLEDPRLGYIQILRFTSRTPDELRLAMQQLRALDLDGWVLDVRNNAGGLLQEAIVVADEFLDTGIIVHERTREDGKVYSAELGGLGTDIPMVTLVNRGTASAAELIAGALQDQERSAIIGQTTYGKGSVQLIFPLPDGSSVHITAAEWLTPNETQIDRQGLIPDVSMIPADDGRDVELDEAIRYLNAAID